MSEHAPPAGQGKQPGGPHPDLDRLADLDAGVLDDAALRAHAGGCAECGAALAAIAAVRADLAALPPVTMPDDVAARLDAALTAATAAGDPGSAASGPVVATDTVVPLEPRRRRRFTNGSVAGAAAAIVVLALAGGVIYNHIASSGSGSPASTAASSLSPDSLSGNKILAVPVTNSGTTYSKADLAGHLPALLDGTASFGTAEGTAGSTGSTGSGAGTAHGSKSGSTPAPSKLNDRTAAGAAAPRPLALPALPAHSVLVDHTVLSRCVADLGGGAAPLAVDIGRFGRTPAAVFVFSTPGEPDKVDVFVVAADCPQGSVLYFARLTRP